MATDHEHGQNVDSEHDPQPAGDVTSQEYTSSGSGFGGFVILVALVLVSAIGFSALMKQEGGKQGGQDGVVSSGPLTGGLPAGQPLPEIQAAGWINSEGVSRNDLDGSVVVLHGWFVGCKYCWQEAPELVKLHEKYADQGVKFVGLTPDEPGALEGIRGYVEKNGITWPQGYYALDTLIALDAEYFPIVWVIGRDGTIAWSKDSGGDLEQAIRDALDG